MPPDVKGIIFDVDGVLEFQGNVYPGAVETLDALRDKGILLRFLTNSTLKSRASCAERLRKSGFTVHDHECITASYATAMYLKRLKPRSCWVMLEREGLDEFREFEQDTDNPEYVVVGDNRSKFDFEHLNKALRLLLDGAKLVGMSPELVDASMGDMELNVGSWVGMLERAADVQATFIGKPNSYGFELAMATMGLGKGEVLMVGDRVSTDVKGAKGFGLRAALVRTGDYDERDLHEGWEPDFIVDSVSDILGILA
jgi:HAD superfamily hydrolase (TIGR01458 family)